DVAAEMRGEQQEPERERRPRFQGPARGDAMKQGHDQAQGEHHAPSHGRQRYRRARVFDNAPQRRYFPFVSPKNWIEAVRFGDDGLVPVVAQSALAGEVLMVAYAASAALEHTRAAGARGRTPPAGSATATPLGAGGGKIAQKVGEEAVETVVAATAEDQSRLASEAADLLYHLLVLFAAKQLPLDRVLEELESRAR